jgi:hypothetical protein
MGEGKSPADRKHGNQQAGDNADPVSHLRVLSKR